MCAMEFWLKGLWKKAQRLNAVVLLATMCLATMGICFVRSACSSRGSVELQGLWVGQMQFAIIGFGMLLVLALTDYRKWIRWAPLIYALVLISLVLVLIPGIGVERMGARRWLFSLQPSEPAKLGILFLLAWLLGRGKESFYGVKGLFWCAVLAGVPAALILLEPDLGTALVLGPTVLAMLFVAKVAQKTLLFGLLLFVALVGYELTMVKIAKAEGQDPARAEQLLKWTGLREHQVERVETFLYPDRSLYDRGYNARQSEIAVGSGGAWGKGYGKGVQHRLGYLPAAVSMNDFIFPVVAEELGFFGSVILIGLYFFGLMVPGVIIALRCRDDVGRLLCVGVVALLFCHVFTNIGMTVRIVPITGLPLPFISQGGTFMLVMMIAMGVLESVAIHGRSTEAVFRH